MEILPHKDKTSYEESFLLGCNIDDLVINPSSKQNNKKKFTQMNFSKDDRQNSDIKKKLKKSNIIETASSRIFDNLEDYKESEISSDSADSSEMTDLILSKEEKERKIKRITKKYLYWLKDTPDSKKKERIKRKENILSDDNELRITYTKIAFCLFFEYSHIPLKYLFSGLDSCPQKA